MSIGPADATHQPDAERVGPLPYPEARPPHLPDRLTAISPLVIPFVLLAGFHVWLIWAELAPLGQLGISVAPMDVVGPRVSGIAASLFGAALFLRHPDAIRTLPLLTVGVVLFAMAEVLSILDVVIRPILFTLTPPDEINWTFAPADTAYQVLTSLVSIFGVIYTARGLSAARLKADTIPFQGIAVLLVVLTILSLVASIGWVVPDLTDQTALTIARFGLGLVMTFLATLAWSYLFLVAVAGLAARERPRLGWLFAGVAVLLFLAVRIGVSAIGSILYQLDAIWVQLPGHASNIAWILLLLAFASGLPGTDEPQATPTPDVDPTATPDRPAAMPPDSGAG